MRVILTLLILIASPGFAQSRLSLLEKFNAGELIDGAEWDAITAGKTITYAIGGFDTYVEQYDPNSNTIWGEYIDGTCFEGYWQEIGASLCFFWEGIEPVCSQQVRYNDEIIVMMTKDDMPTYSMQTITKITNIPVSCGPDLMM